MIYNISDKPKTIKEWGLYSFQMLLSVIVATTLIAQICGTPVSSCMVGGCIGTIIYEIITGFKSPMYISNCGATCSAVIGALAIGGNQLNYTAVVLGGIFIAVVYILFSFLIRSEDGFKKFNSLFPPTIVGAITIVIGLNLATFIPTYVLVNGESTNWGVIIAIFTMLVTAVSSHYCRGFLKTIPFLIGILAGYFLSVVLTISGVCSVVDFSVFNQKGIFSIPDFAFLHLNSTSLTGSQIAEVALLFVPVAICALLEHYSDHKVLSNVIGVDLTKNPGLHKTLVGDGIASFVGTVICGLPNTSYGESIATIGYSKVASVYTTFGAAIIMGILAFVTPFQNFVLSIPSAVFGGSAMILYGYISLSGLKTIVNNKVDLENQKNLLIICIVLTVGVSGIYLFTQSFTGVSLAMVLGIILNFILKEKTNNG